MTDLPTGTVTFLFTDIEGSTRLWAEHGEVMGRAVARHDELIGDAVEGHGGYVFSTAGDSFSAAFSVAHEAVDAAVQAQVAITSEGWGETSIRVRMGIHIGEAEERAGDYFGSVVNETARLMASAHGGQILASLWGYRHSPVGSA
jgi:class 3 adenylate cyclase